MGIKGIYKELGPGQRISLSKLAAQSIGQHDRPLRIAVDIAIWQFQSQAARGGTNPAIRTLFYRLVRLLGTPTQPLFVFDGPNKPRIKRNKRSGRGDGVAIASAKRLIRLFGFAVHDAPGEAEAECAWLQRNRVVDAVLSEDVDTIMFGCTRTLRNWSGEGRSTAPTHITLYDVEEMKLGDLGLDREGMVLVALMSGGDYQPEGIPGCGIKVACEAAKAGYGKSLCRLKRSDHEGLRAWKESLTHELHSNESGYFRTKHKALVIPKGFPSIEVLQCYTHPVVSPVTKLDSIREGFFKTRKMDLEMLREFARETFDWDFRIGATKFMRVLAPARFVDALVHGPSETTVAGISGQRTHVSTDGSLELKFSYIPQELVPIDLSKEVEEDISYGRDGLALNSDDEIDEVPTEQLSSQAKALKDWDPSKPNPTWILEELATRSFPHLVTKWRADNAAKEARKLAKGTASKSTAKSKSKTPVAAAGAMDQFVRVTKAVSTQTTKPSSKPPSKPRSVSPTKRPVPRRPGSPPLAFEQSKKSMFPTQVEEAGHWDALTLNNSSQSPPRTPKPGRPDAILITSSPIGPPETYSPPRSEVQETSESLRALLAAPSAPPVKTRRDFRRVKTTGSLMDKPQAPRASDLKQTSLDEFTVKTREPIATSQPVPPKSTILSVTRAASLGDPFDDSDGDLPPISDLMPEPPTSPKKRNHHRPSPSESKDQSPRPKQKKKILVPRTSDVGYFREIEVDADMRDAIMEKETARLRKKGVQGSAMRLSDVSFIDLTQDG